MRLSTSYDNDSFFCSLCWCSTEGAYTTKKSNKLFCKYHLCAGETKKINYRDKRLIIRSLVERNHAIPKHLSGAELYRHLSRNLPTLATSPKKISEFDSFNDEKKLLSIEFSRLISRYYPITFKCIKACFNKKNIKEMVACIVYEISKPSNSATLSSNGIEQNRIAIAELSDPNLLIQMLARHEAYQIIHEKPVKRGPKQRLYRDETLRTNIAQLYNTFAEAGIYRCQSRIADQLDISTARVSVIMKELVREGKLTKSMTRKKD